MSFFRGFKYAACGVIYCIKNERNMRFHTVAALYVLIFARFFHFSRAEWVLLLVVIGGVMAAEAFNTSIERLSDRVTEKKDKLIKQAKDTAAGAVLVLAVFAAAVGVVLFSAPGGWQEAFDFYIGHPINLSALALLTAVSPLYIFLPGRKNRKKDPDKKS